MDRARARWTGWGRRALAAAVLGAAVLVPLLALGPGAAQALLPTVSGCGFTLGPASANGAAGTLYFTAVLEPVSPAENCSVAVTITASAVPVTGQYTNITDNPLSATETATFTPGRLAPALGVAWAGLHCADPPGPGTLAMAIGGQPLSFGIDPTSCGGSSSSLYAVSVPLDSEVGIAPTVDDHGYRTVSQSGFLSDFGDAASLGVTAYTNAPVVGVASPPAGQGAWVAAADGGVFAYGTAGFYGSAAATALNAPVVGLAPTPDGKGYWLVAADGGVFSYGDAVFYGSMGGIPLNAPVVGMAATADGKGYWLVGADGGVFAFGDAVYAGSMASAALTAPMVGMASDPSGGYWLVGADGGVFAFGGALFYGSTGGITLNAPVSGMAATSDGQGYWLVGADNGVFAFGNAGFYGSDPGVEA